MPYPALPPELPPIVSVAAEAVHCSRLTDSASSGLPAKPESLKSESSKAESLKFESSTARSGGQSRVAAPEKLAVQLSNAQASTDGKEQKESKQRKAEELFPCASLLGSSTATGYLPTQSTANLSQPSVSSSPLPTAALPTTIASRRPFPARIQAISAPEQVDVPRSPQTPAPTKPANSANLTNSASPAYEISGVSGRLSNLPEKTVMQQLNQALVFEALAESYQALSTLAADDLRRFAQRSNRVAQASGNPAETIPSPSETLFPEGRFPVAPIPTPPAPNPPTDPAGTTAPDNAAPPTPDSVIEVTADRQEYDERRQIFTAEGKVMMRFRNALLEGDRVQVNLTNRLTVAEGNVALTRGRQVLRGQRFEYNFVQGVGTVEKARGDIYLPSIGTDTALNPTVPGEQPTLSPPISDRITSQQPIENVTSPGGVNFSVGAGRDVNRLPGALPRGGRLNRLRFEAERVDFTPEGWVAANIDITNDPFSPPEFVLRADKAVLTRLSPLEDEVVATRPRLVFDQKVSVPILRRRFLLSRAEQEPAFFRFGFDNQDRGGLFLEGILNVISTSKVNFSIYPQIFLQRMFFPAEGQDSDGVGDLSNYGVRTALDVFLTDRTTLRARAALTSLDFDEFEERFRASVRLEQLLLPTRYGYHGLGLEYSYRDRLFNGSLGFQTVQTSLGAVFQSPNYILGNSGFVANYQAGYQLVSADTDRLDLLDPVRENNRVQLGRFQATASIGRNFVLWTGKPLPATRNEGLNYTANPVVPQITLATSLRGVFSQYSSGDSQQDLIGTVGLSAQFGHFSRKFFDYTSFSVFYTQVIGSGQSPFLFDRTVDNRVLSLSFFQQLYGPVRAGVQTAINLDTREAFSTDIFLEYSRRTHGIILRYNPVLEIGSISFRVSDFNWGGTAEPFQGSGVVPVDAGVERRY
ncbi:MAG: DUF3769 domain-containing protein [Leptolyngbyaceae cyanobacterium bins.302]|nr:DUF3769 domain-containing protein [Leptolyngbyaceae cyanobacterium bins.302]